MERTSTLSSLERQKVYDPVLRLLHLVIGVSILGLAISGKAGEFMDEGSARGGIWTLHITLGYILCGGLLGRLVWGVVGPKHARLSDLFHLGVWLNTLKTRTRPVLTRFGHDPLASLAYLGFYALAALAGGTGLGLAALEHDRGPLASILFDAVWLEEAFEEPHEVAGTLILFFIVLHLGALIWHEAKEGIPLAQGMVSGYQYRHVASSTAGAPPAPSEVPVGADAGLEGQRGQASSRLLFLLSLVTGGGLLLASLLPLQGLGAPNNILSGYASEARATDPAFKAPDAARGKALYFLQRTTSAGEKESCSTCHSSDPKGMGRTRAGKSIEPMATSANPARFTDPAKVEKWFSRNCKDVLERPCTATEKADFIQYLLTVP